MGKFSAFIPMDRRRALGAGKTLPDRVVGAALFADISGFTSLTSTLRHDLGARRGAEEAVHHVNRVYTALIEQIHHYHGSVIGFSGDAVTCWFDEPAGAESAFPADSSARAVACAGALQAVMARLQVVVTSAGATIPLAIKVAVTAGPARRFLVGDPHHYVIEVLAGNTVDRLATGEQLAKPGQALVAADIIDSLNPPPTVIAWRDTDGERFGIIAAGLASPSDGPDTEPPELDEEIARPWLLPPVFDHLQQGAEEYLAELRPSVAMFVQFSGIDYDRDDGAGEKLDAFVRRVQAIVGRYDGYLLQITMGDKGSYLYASFGAPVTHENDLVRAASAALELRDLPDSMGFLQPLRIGISRGLAHSGAYGSARRRAFGVMGDEVNLSARLMGAAGPGRILLSPSAAGGLGQGFEILARPPLSLKGVTGPYAPFELRGRYSRSFLMAQTESVTIGRETERELLSGALAGLAAGQSRAIVIEGAAGIGKSHLVRNVLNDPTTIVSAATVLVGSGDSVERSTPYHAWRAVCSRLFLPSTGEEPAVESWTEGIWARLEPAQAELAPLLNAVLPLNLPDTELTQQMSGEVRQENTQRLLINLLQSALHGQPLILIFEDAHWLDSVSWDLISRVHREIAPLLLIIVTRPMEDDVPGFLAQLRETENTSWLKLDSLPLIAIEQLVRNRLGVQKLSPPVAGLIHDKAEGHPFFAEELALALRDAGLIDLSGGLARFTPGADVEALDFPNTIQGVITSRVDLLPPQQQLTVKVASVIGRIFAFRLLHGIYPVPDAAGLLRENLKRLERLEITLEEAPEPNLAYYFKHTMTQEVVYSLMTFAQRQQLHRGAALWYERNEAGEFDRNAPLLAHHWRLAGDSEKAAVYYERAGENALRDYANREAIRFLSLAGELAGDSTSPLVRARWHRLIGEAHYRLTEIESCRANYETALALLDRSIPPSVAGRSLGLGKEFGRQAAHRLVARRLVGRAGVEERERLLEASRAIESLGEIYYNLGDFLATFYCTLTAFNLAETAGPSPELMRGYANMCPTFGAVSLNSAADSYRARALALEPQIGDLPARAWSRIALSTHSVWVGAWERAEQEIREALDIYTQLGDWRRWSVAAWLWPQVAQSRGDREQARDRWAELYEVALRSRDTRHQVRGRGGQYFNFLSLGQPERAYSCLEGARLVLEENTEMMPVEERLWHSINAGWALHEGEWARARAEAKETLAAIGRARFKFDLLEVFATPAEVLLALWERGEATAADAATGCKALNGYARTYAFARPRALRLRGHYAILDGKMSRAKKLCEKSIAQAEKLGMPREAALTEALIERYQLRAA